MSTLQSAVLNPVPFSNPVTDPLLMGKSEKHERSDLECLFVVTPLDLSGHQNCFTKQLGNAFF